MPRRESALKLLGARYYDAASGRFASVDPIAAHARGESPYVYGGNRPLSAMLEGIPRESVPTAQRLIDMFATNQLTAFEAPPPTQAEEIASLKLQGAMKQAAASQQIEV